MQLVGAQKFSTVMPRLLVGDETGLLKVAYANDRSVETRGLQDRQMGVLAIEKLGSDSVAVLRRNGEVSFWNDNIGLTEEKSKIECLFSSSLHDFDAPKGLVPVYGSSLSDIENLVAYSESGELKTLDLKLLSGESMSKAAKLATVKGPIHTMAACANGGIAFGGQENDLTFFDATTQQTVWKAKNVPYDKLRLRVPIWITAIHFPNPAQQSISSGANVITGTGYRQIRLYDTRTSQQPVKSFEMGEYRVTTLLTLPSSTNDLYVADTIGGIYHYDLRTNRLLHSLKGCMGAIRSMSLTEDESFLACVGLDRRLWWFDLQSHTLKRSVYMQNRMTSCVILQDDFGSAVDSSSLSKGRKRRLDEEDEDDDDEGENEYDEVDEFFDGDEEEDIEGDDNEDDDEDDQEEGDDGDEQDT